MTIGPTDITQISQAIAQALRAEFTDRDTSKNQCESIKEIKETLYGNGREGMKMLVTRIEERQKNLIWWNRATIAVALAATAGLVVDVLSRQ